MASVLDRVRDIAADKLSVDASDVSAESSFTEDLNADSLDVVELIM
ncbi:MAG: acyl carrier protein, partial [Dehalococcoidia bacterium]